jgi:hypothetical protein
LSSALDVDVPVLSGGGNIDNPRCALLVITDGRWDYLTETLTSHRHLDYRFSAKIIVNDSGAELPFTLRGWTVVNNPERLGLAGAIGAGWDALPDDVKFVFHLEDDFVFPDPVPVGEMIGALQRFPNLAQVALMRQPWSPQEQAVGSVYSMTPNAWDERDGLVFHRRLFTFNPCVYPRWVTEVGPGLEQEVTDRLLERNHWFSYLGTTSDPPRCHHIGVRRSEGYRW